MLEDIDIYYGRQGFFSWIFLIWKTCFALTGVENRQRWVAIGIHVLLHNIGAVQMDLVLVNWQNSQDYLQN